MISLGQGTFRPRAPKRTSTKRVPFPATNRDPMNGDWGLENTLSHHPTPPPRFSPVVVHPSLALLSARGRRHTLHTLLRSPHRIPPPNCHHLFLQPPRTCTHCSRSCTSTSDINPHTCIPHPSFHPSFVSLLVYAYALIPNSFSMAARRPSMPVSLVISGVRLAAATGASTTGRSATGQYIWAK